jgi:hypothetical protein
MIRLIFFIFICQLSGLLHAENNVSVKSVAESKIWLKLLGYESREKSAITSADFFFADDGSINPLSELQATIKAFNVERTQNPNQHPTCKFPGRYRYLKNMGLLGSEKYNLKYCSDFIAFSGIDDATIIYSPSLVYVTGYLGNPASYFGHLLINLDNDKNGSKSNNLQNIALNFGARIPDNENMALYVIKGFIGTYDALYTSKEFYYHLHLYSEEDLRDIWEYRLNLSPIEYQLLSGHLWEMIGATHKYYFANRNCAYAVAKSLELVTDNELSSRFSPWVAPQAVLQSLQEATTDGKNIVSKINYLPSRQSKLYKKFKQLSRHEKTTLKAAITNGPISIKRTDIPNSEKIRVADTLMDYHRMIFNGSDMYKYPPFNDAVNYRYTLPIGAPQFELNDTKQPHLGHKPSYLELGYKGGDVSSDYGTLRIRPAYYDQLDAGFGHIKGSALSMFDATFAFSESGVEIEHIDLLKIENFYAFKTDLPGDDKSPWTLGIGAKKMNNSCEDCLGYFAYGGLGYAYSGFDDKVFFNMMGHVGAMGEKISGDALYFESKIGINIFSFKKLGVLYETSLRLFFNSGSNQNIHRLMTRFALTDDLDIRATFIADESNTFKLSMGRYF